MTIFAWICGAIAAGAVIGIVIGNFVALAWRVGIIALAAAIVFALAEPDRASQGIAWALDSAPISRVVHLGDVGRARIGKLTHWTPAPLW